MEGPLNAPTAVYDLETGTATLTPNRIQTDPVTAASCECEYSGKRDKAEVTTKEFVTLEKRLLPDFPEFTIKGSLMFLTPVEHTLRGFSFESSAFDKNSFYVTAFFMALCIPRRYLIFNLGQRLRERGGDRWTINNKNFEAALRSEMEKQVLFLSRLKTPMDIVEAAIGKGSSNDPYCQETIAYMLALAEQVDNAIEALDRLVAMLEPGIQWQHEMALRAQLLKSKLIDNLRAQNSGTDCTKATINGKTEYWGQQLRLRCLGQSDE